MIILYCIYSFFTNVACKFDKYMEMNKRKRVIFDIATQKPYIIRYYIFKKQHDAFPFNIYIHKIIASDSVDYHDHPSSYLSFILYGGIWENTPRVRYWRGIFDFQFFRAEYTHRIELDKKHPMCVELCIPFFRKRQWGFIADGYWMPNHSYNELLRKRKDYAKQLY